MFSLYTENTPFPVIDKDEWWADAFDATKYGRDIDFSRPFFEQFAELRTVVPHFSISVTNTDNSEYCNNVSDLKNCYLVFNTSGAEDCMNCESVWYSKDCLDCTQTTYSQLCYDCVDCTKSYDLQSSEGCSDCSESAFLMNCRSCNNCFGCTNLRHKQYCIFNKQHTRKEYEDYLRQLDLSSWKQRSLVTVEVQKNWLAQPRPHMRSSQAEESTGDFLYEVRDVKHSYFVRQAENVKYGCYLNDGSKDCMDHTLMGIRAELIYESSVCGYDSHSLRFCYNCWISNTDLLYCWLCRSTRECFGSISLKKKQFCILNKQYSEQEYNALVPKLIEHMQHTGEWGEFFPLTLAPVPYNRSLAYRFFPLSEQQVHDGSMEWYQEIPSEREVSVKSLPDKPIDTNEAVVSISEQSGKLFRIPKQEAKRCVHMRVPLPRLAYDERIENRAKKLGGVKLHARTCAKTGKKILTTFEPNSPWTIWERDEYENYFQ